MSAAVGPRWRRQAALLLALAAGTSGLAGCEYADDVGLAPAAVSPSASSGPDAPQAPRDAELVAAEARNTVELDRILGALPDRLLTGGAGGVRDSASGGFTTSVRVTVPGRYTVTAACIGAPGAHLTVTQFAGQGGAASTLLELNLECGGVASSEVNLETGSVSAHVVQFPEGSADPGIGAVAGVRISGSGSAP
ncbi:hypothetical protein QFZ79_002002 [Arthrobacter sp. V4I6]|uniref:hypothetical protein n=1 Tax=unclassified Arthrobacter TaxID=235627 RepID=UPI002784CA65|nr:MULTISPECIES: hypothetical protein [unclassified Arthrobacter]MDQ0819711.1 hypothetical protein [Arthrobacter sp. V1I7]MDQ0853891.1 hypothetical protein [Arthrobacter sp. V4I6]